MKNRKKDRPNKSPIFLIGLILGGLLLIVSAVLVMGGGASGTPRLSVDQEKIDFGDVRFGVNKTFSIKVTNSGDGLLRFKEQPYIQVLEGC